MNFVIVIFGIAAFFGVVLSVPVYFLWNCTLPDIFGVKEITLVQALCLSLLCRCLFGTFWSGNK